MTAPGRLNRTEGTGTRHEALHHVLRESAVTRVPRVITSSDVEMIDHGLHVDAMSHPSRMCPRSSIVWTAATM